MSVIPQKNPVIFINGTGEKAFVKTLPAAACIFLSVWPYHKHKIPPLCRLIRFIAFPFMYLSIPQVAEHPFFRRQL